MGLRIKNYYGGSLKNPIFRVRWLNKKPIYRGTWPKKAVGEPWTFCRFRGGLAKKRDVVFLRGVDTPMHAMTQI